MVLGFCLLAPFLLPPYPLFVLSLGIVNIIAVLGVNLVMGHAGQISLGHVGFYRGESTDSVYVLGGNEDNMVQIEPISKKQLRGYWWPKSLPPPGVGAIVVPPGTPKHQTKVT